MKWAVTIVSPAGYPHAEAFREVAQATAEALGALGHDAVVTTELPLPGRRVLLFGANLLAPGQALPKDTVVFNLEQVSKGSPWMKDDYLDLLRRFEVWDYSVRNIEALAALGVSGVRHVPIGFSPCLARFTAAPVQDLDVLLVGSLNPRRVQVLQGLKARGLRVHAAFGVYGAARDALLARAKVQLNVHFFEARVFEIVRVSYLLANRCFVVSETGADAQEEAYFRDGVAFTPYEALVEQCARFVGDAGARQRFAEAGCALMQARPLAASLQSALRQAA